jgi:hypothetical protein
MTVLKQPDDRDQRRRDDFEFMALCASKNNMAMYQLLRDRSLDEPKPTVVVAQEYLAKNGLAARQAMIAEWKHGDVLVEYEHAPRPRKKKS